MENKNKRKACAKATFQAECIFSSQARCNCLQAVHQMHSSGFCHADLKNSNAMVSHAQGQVIVKLVDMACSQQQNPGQ